MSNSREFFFLDTLSCGSLHAFILSHKRQLVFNLLQGNDHKEMVTHTKSNTDFSTSIVEKNTSETTTFKYEQK